ncbi:MAG: nitroreductase family protein [Acidimicrobiia bacterium]|nr:nitroreductase family protein [Acidimicrobiia bacterium]
MEFQDVMRRRHMTRSFTGDPVPEDVVTTLLANAHRAPSAGNTKATEFLVLAGPEETGRFWAATLPETERGAFPWPGLLDAPLLVVFLAHEAAYRARYAEADKGVVEQEGFWPVPYWYVDAGIAAMLAQLTVVDHGLGCLFFGIFPRRLEAFRSAFGIPESHVPVGALAVGRAAPRQRRSRSLARPTPTVGDVTHRGRW